eukprot:scaffold539457_cov46-Prasinocladus_malaysianus.AAC.1
MVVPPACFSVPAGRNCAALWPKVGAVESRRHLAFLAFLGARSVDSAACSTVAPRLCMATSNE